MLTSNGRSRAKAACHASCPMPAKPAQSFDWDGRPYRHAHRDSSNSQQLRRHHGHHVPEKNAELSPNLWLSR